MQTTPYNPCVAGPTPAVKCDFDERLCRDYESYPCSEGYCLGGDIEENEGIPGNGIVADKTFDIDGVYRITQSVKFTNCVFKMRGASQIVVSPTSTFVKIVFDNCSFFGCELMWQGIAIDASSTSSLIFLFTDCQVEDAYVGLNLHEGPYYVYSIKGCQFRNNHIGISNALQTYVPLNATILDNTFTQSDGLAEVPEEMEALAMPDYPVGHAGILLTNTAASVGVATGAPGQPNLFSCIMNGIVANDCGVSSFRNEFVDLHDDGRGIWANGGSLKVRWNYFISAGATQIEAAGADLLVWDSFFEGESVEGIRTWLNLNGEFVDIRKNEFTLEGERWVNGIHLERSIATSGLHNHIYDENNFTINYEGAPGEFLTAISVVDQGVNTDDLIVEDNRITVESATAKVDGISLVAYESNNHIIRFNTVSYETEDDMDQYGIYIYQPINAPSSNNHVSGNTVSGTEITSMQCCIRAVGAHNFEFCENNVDFGLHGLHFLGMNDIEMKENVINHHELGINIDFLIGNQPGHGNIWSSEVPGTTDCTGFAATTNPMDNPFDPLNSLFLVPEDDELPFLPPPVELDPDPTMGPNWFAHNPTILPDYCDPESTNSPELLPYEEDIIAETFPFTDAELWDVQRKLYYKLLLYPALRPASSPAETFFNSLDNTPIEGFAMVNLMIAEAFEMSGGDQGDLDENREDIFSAWTDLEELDEEVDFSDPEELSETTYYDDKAILLGQIADSEELVRDIETDRDAQITDGLEDALDYNDNISTSETWEAARRTYNDLRLRRMLREPLTEEVYEDALDLAHADPAVAGEAGFEARYLLAPCDQIPALEEEEEERPAAPGIEQAAEAIWFSIAPNPVVDGSCHIFFSRETAGVLEIASPSGAIVARYPVVSGSKRLVLNAENLGVGLYFVRFSDLKSGVLPSQKLSIIR